MNMVAFRQEIGRRRRPPSATPVNDDERHPRAVRVRWAPSPRWTWRQSAAQPMPADDAVELAAIDLGRLRRLGHVSLVLLEERLDVSLLERIEQPPAGLGIGNAQVRGVEARGRALLRRRMERLLESRAALEVIPQLPHVARPGRQLEPGE